MTTTATRDRTSPVNRYASSSTKKNVSPSWSLLNRDMATSMRDVNASLLNTRNPPMSNVKSTLQNRTAIPMVATYARG